MHFRFTRLLPLLSACASFVGCTGADDGAVTPSGGTSSVGGNAGAGGSAQAGTGGTGGATGGAGGAGSATGGSAGSTGGVGGGTAGVGGSTGGSAGAAAGAGGDGATAGIGGGAAGIGGAAGSGGASGNAGTGGSAGAGGSAGKGGSAGSGGSGGAGPSEHFSFFVASMEGLVRLAGNPDGFGGDFRYGGETTGLGGADKICTELAESSLAGSGAKQWRAFLSVTAGPGGGPLNAIDRIGEGPWYDRLGRIVAMSVADLQNTRPMGADPLIINNLPNEFGVGNRNPNGTGDVDNHHVMTGSNAMGELDSMTLGNTCNDWTSAEGPTGQPMGGFSWPRGGGGGGTNGSHWITGFRAHGCAPGISIIQDGGGDSSILTVGEGGGYGAIYCFALTP